MAAQGGQQGLLQGQSQGGDSTDSEETAKPRKRLPSWDDVLFGGRRSDVLVGGPGRDVLRGGRNVNVIIPRLFG